MSEESLVVIIAIQAVVIVVLTWRAFGAIPREIVDILLSVVEQHAAKTPSKLDDEAIARVRNMIIRFDEDVDNNP
jgi:hypothetical protein